MIDLREAARLAIGGEGLVYLHPQPGRASFVFVSYARIRRELGRAPWSGRYLGQGELGLDSFATAAACASEKGAGGIVYVQLQEPFYLMTLKRFERLLGGDPGHDDSYPHVHAYA